MKKLAILSLIIGLSTSGFAQVYEGLTGPKAKNAKPWKDAIKTVKLVSAEKKTTVVGPKAKNAKAWEDDGTKKVEVVSTKRSKNLKGPKAKNAKPWKN